MEESAVLKMLLHDAGVTRAREFAAALLAPLLASDQAEMVLETVRVFLEVNCHIREASRALGVHENTVRYRIGKASEAMGLDLKVLADAFQVRLEIGRASCRESVCQYV